MRSPRRRGGGVVLATIGFLAFLLGLLGLTCCHEYWFEIQAMTTLMRLVSARLAYVIDGSADDSLATNCR